MSEPTPSLRQGSPDLGATAPSQEALALAAAIRLQCSPMADGVCRWHGHLEAKDGWCVTGLVRLARVDAALAKAKADELENLARVLDRIEGDRPGHLHRYRVKFVQAARARAAEFRGGGDRG